MTDVTRRRFLQYIASGALMQAAPARAADAPRPNILWITCEDLSPHFGCYGDANAVTPAVDRLAREGVRYDAAFASAPVCAPARSSLITGVYACSLGSHHMRSQVKLPEGIRPFPALLREAGYYCTNNAKTDYNFTAPAGTWDASSKQTHWRNRPEGKPFFSVFNFEVTHESQIRVEDSAWEKRIADLPAAARHDPARVTVPPYHPDTPEVRKDWARYHDNVSRLDRQVAGILKQLEDDGLAEDTIVFFFSDHGDGMPRGKRWLYDSGLRVPLVIRFPEKYRHLAPGAPGSVTDRLVEFTDFGPTVLRLAGATVPAYMQGTPFLGEPASPPRRYVHGFRDRMDERYDCSRTVRDERYRYIRNFQPHLAQGEHNEYMFQTPTTCVWEQRYRDHALTPAQAFFWKAPKPVEELYDTRSDPHQLTNLAADPTHGGTLDRMRVKIARWMTDIVDLGLLAEAEMHARLGAAPYAAVRREPARYPLARLLETVDLQRTGSADALIARLADADAAVRFQAVVGLLHVGGGAKGAFEPLRRLVASDPSPSVRIAAAEWVGRYGAAGSIDSVLQTLKGYLTGADPHAALEAINVLDRLDARAAPLADAIRHVQESGTENLQKAARKTLRDLGTPS